MTNVGELTIRRLEPSAESAISVGAPLAFVSASSPIASKEAGRWPDNPEAGRLAMVEAEVRRYVKKLAKEGRPLENLQQSATGFARIAEADLKRRNPTASIT
ncbi:hypothetical protein [Bradyrhizobium sp. CIR3A]|uniref:hypothetical protein n=1 Tax=Bradyrhizobium sp. CIR3A TaxID=2663838 RepID=UPI001606C5A6|nr:hypothetical protein [Bradyrhizobium sp. CIR3A]MBB4263050.1 hypothetical protein [Bradyrhizobium sp. CIR3A]